MWHITLSLTNLKYLSFGFFLLPTPQHIEDTKKNDRKKKNETLIGSSIHFV
jgi:hypothetical protein